MAEFEAWQTALLSLGFILVLVLGFGLYWYTSDAYKIRAEQIKLGYKVPTCMSYLRMWCICCLGPLARSKWERENLVWRSKDYGDEHERWQPLLKMPEAEQRALSANPNCKWAQLPRGDAGGGKNKLIKTALRRLRALMMNELIEQALDATLDDYMRQAQKSREDERKAERVRATAARWRKNSKPSMALQMDDVESESSEDDWEIGMAQETSLHFLKVVPKAYVVEEEDDGIATQRIPIHRAPESVNLLRVVQPGPTGWPESRPVSVQQDAWEGSQGWGHDVVTLSDLNTMEQAKMKGGVGHHRIVAEGEAGQPLVSKPMTIVDLKRVSRIMTQDSITPELASIPLNPASPELLDSSSEPLTAHMGWIAFPHNRVQLEPMSDSPTPQQQYINASYIRGPAGEPNKYIVTQIPLSGAEPGKLSTITHFWRMVWSHRSNTVVCLEPPPRVFWPSEGGTMHVGSTLVTLQHHEKKHEFDVVLVEMTEGAQKWRVEIFVFNRWPKGGHPETSPILAMLHQVARFSSHNPGGPVIMMDAVGGDRAGTVIALEHLIWQIETQEIVDVMQVVRTLRTDRGGLISQPSFYFAIHKLATMYSLTIGIGASAPGMDPHNGHAPPAYVAPPS